MVNVENSPGIIANTIKIIKKFKKERKEKKEKSEKAFFFFHILE